MSTDRGENPHGRSFGTPVWLDQLQSTGPRHAGHAEHSDLNEKVEVLLQVAGRILDTEASRRNKLAEAIVSSLAALQAGHAVPANHREVLEAYVAAKWVIGPAAGDGVLTDKGPAFVDAVRTLVEVIDKTRPVDQKPDREPALYPAVAFYRCAAPGCGGRISVEHTHSDDPMPDLSRLPFNEAAKVAMARTDLALHAIEAAALALHWARVNVDGAIRYYCTQHARNTACARCHFQDCACMGGPRLDRVFISARWPWPSEPPVPQDRHLQGLPCAFCDGRVADVEHSNEDDRHAIVHGVVVCRRCLPTVESILTVVESGSVTPAAQKEIT